MRVIRFGDNPYLPAGHENPAAPGVLRKVLLGKADLRPGRVQMINWASQGVGKRFASHYHEDMQEVFVLVQGTAEITVGGETATLRRGDAVLIDPGEVHTMRNLGAEEVEYLAIGVISEAGGRTVIVEQS
jgi:mannose-6-phosphate isomerase-like protein (cupin superfamily)